MALLCAKDNKTEGGHRGFQDYRHLCYYFYVFLRFYFFQNQKVVTFYVFCRVSYVFSNYGSWCQPKAHMQLPISQQW